MPENPLEFQELVAKLNKKVRDGQISAESLRFAAYLGDSAACHVLGSRAPRAPTDPEQWFEGLEEKKDIQMRVLIASCRERIAEYENIILTDQSFKSRQRMVQGWKDLLCAIEDYFLSPNNQKAFYIGEAGIGLVEGIGEALIAAQTGLADYAGAMLSPHYQLALEVELELERMIMTLRLFMEPLDAPSSALFPIRMKAVQSEVVPFLLEEKDPLCERVQQRNHQVLEDETRKDVRDTLGD